MLIDQDHPWTCPLEDCHYRGRSTAGRTGHLRMKHGISPPPETDVQLVQLQERQLPPDSPPAEAEAAQPDDVAEALTKLTAEIHQLVAQGGGKPHAEASELPTMEQFLAHCEGGTCATHTKALDELKATIVKAAYDNMPEDLVRQKAEEHNLVPTSIDVEVG